jgi:hypothetical protein
MRHGDVTRVEITKVNVEQTRRGSRISGEIEHRR